MLYIDIDSETIVLDIQSDMVCISFERVLFLRGEGGGEIEAAVLEIPVFNSPIGKRPLNLPHQKVDTSCGLPHLRIGE